MAKQQFRIDLVTQCVASTMDILTRGVRLGMSRDEILLFQARMNHEINIRLLTSEIAAIAIVSTDEPNGEQH